MEKKDLELYVHIPFCVKKCAYCDFLSAPADAQERTAYVYALIKEIRTKKKDYSGCRVNTVFLGGGTPSILGVDDTRKIFRALCESFDIAEDAEITMEVNPGTVTEEKASAWKKCGVNRLSIGLQSADDRELKMLGRIHTYREFSDTWEIVRRAGFRNVNIDLISAIPGQTPESWERTLRTAAELEPEHLSAYSLIIEEGTPFSKRKLSLPDEEEEYRMYEETGAVLERYGYRQYEISNYAKEGFPCRHNIGYWKRYDYIGIGLGAASLYLGERFSNTRSMKEYLSMSGEPDKIRRERTVLTRREEMEEFMILGLRMTEGVSEQAFWQQFGEKLDEVYGKVLNKYTDMGFMEQEQGWWRFSRKGIHVSNRILAEFLE